MAKLLCQSHFAQSKHKKAQFFWHKTVQVKASSEAPSWEQAMQHGPDTTGRCDHWWWNPKQTNKQKCQTNKHTKNTSQIRLTDGISWLLTEVNTFISQNGSANLFVYLLYQYIMIWFCLLWVMFNKQQLILLFIQGVADNGEITLHL